MVAVITGDITNSRGAEVAEWLPVLKSALSLYGTEPKDWEIFRGDSFQLLLPPEKALLAAVQIKANIKIMKELDVRMGIGLGQQEVEAERISESNGPAFIRSGECFEALNKQQLAIKTSNQEVDETLNLMFSLALLTMDNWTSKMATAIKTTLEHQDKNQLEIAKLLGKSQSSLSESLNRGGFDEVMRLDAYYQKQLQYL